jgi:hypothetical protein
MVIIAIMLVTTTTKETTMVGITIIKARLTRRATILIRVLKEAWAIIILFKSNRTTSKTVWVSSLTLAQAHRGM